MSLLSLAFRLILLASIVIVLKIAIKEEVLSVIPLTIVGVLLSAVASPPFALAGSYDLSVKVVNALEVEEWAYNSGIAVMRLSGGAWRS